MMHIAHFWGWQNAAQSDWQSVMERFAACGHPGLAMNAELALRAALDPDFCRFLQAITKKSGTCFTGMHAPFGYEWDLLCNDPEFLPVSRHVHRRLLEIMPDEFGINSYTVHLLNSRFTGTQQQADELLEKNLEPLLEIAERKGVTIAIENGFQMIDHPETLLHYMDKYASDNFGCCLDVAHANITAKKCGTAVAAYIKLLLPHIIVSHLHDNDGITDLHRVAGTTGQPDWDICMPLLASAPRLQSLQNESLSENFTVEQLCAQTDRILLAPLRDRSFDRRAAGNQICSD